MLPYEINGLPLHVLLVHVVVIVVPAGAVMTFLGAAWPGFRRKLTFITPLVTFIGLLSVPLATNAGEWLLARVNRTPLIAAHAAIGDTLLPWALGQFVLATTLWVWYRWFAAPRAEPVAPTRNIAPPDSRDPFAPRSALPTAGAPAPAVVVTGASVQSAATSSSGTSTAPGSLAASHARSASSGSNPASATTGRFGWQAGRRASVVVSIAFVVLSLVLGASTTARVIQIGESGAAAIWTGSFSDTPK
ncbi:hypothetical protein BH09ACT6_BH09ACT6_21700 [soil metagenome]